MSEFLGDLFAKEFQDERRVVKLLHWMTSTPANHFFPEFLDHLEPLEGEETKYQLCRQYGELDLSQASMIVEDPLHYSNLQRDYHIFWPNQLSIVIEAKIKAELSASQLKNYIQGTLKPVKQKFIIIVTKTKNSRDLEHLRHNLHSEMKRTLWITWKEIQTIYDNVAEKILQKLHREGLSTSEIQLFSLEYSRLLEFSKVISHLYSPPLPKVQRVRILKGAEKKHRDWARAIFLEHRLIVRDKVIEVQEQRHQHLLQREDLEEILYKTDQALFPGLKSAPEPHRVIHLLTLNAWSGFIENGTNLGVALFLDDHPTLKGGKERGSNKRYDVLPLEVLEEIADSNSWEGSSRTHYKLMMKLNAHQDERFSKWRPHDWNENWYSLKSQIDRNIAESQHVGIS